MADAFEVYNASIMGVDTILGIIGIAATAGVGIWAINDVRQQVHRLILMDRNLAWVRVQNDLVWLFVDPTDKAHGKEIAKGLGEFAVLARELDPQRIPEDLKTAAENEALEMAERLVADGYAKWKMDLDMKKVLQRLEEWKAQKSKSRVENLWK